MITFKEYADSRSRSVHEDLSTMEIAQFNVQMSQVDDACQMSLSMGCGVVVVSDGNSFRAYPNQFVPPHRIYWLTLEEQDEAIENIGELMIDQETRADQRGEQITDSLGPRPNSY